MNTDHEEQISFYPWQIKFAQPEEALMESLLGFATVLWDHEPFRLPLSRPSATLSPAKSGGEGRERGRFMGGSMGKHTHEGLPIRVHPWWKQFALPAEAFGMGLHTMALPGGRKKYDLHFSEKTAGFNPVRLFVDFEAW